MFQNYHQISRNSQKKRKDDLAPAFVIRRYQKVKVKNRKRRKIFIISLITRSPEVWNLNWKPWCHYMCGPPEIGSIEARGAKCIKWGEQVQGALNDPRCEPISLKGKRPLWKFTCSNTIALSDFEVTISCLKSISNPHSFPKASNNCIAQATQTPAKICGKIYNTDWMVKNDNCDKNQIAWRKCEESVKKVDKKKLRDF